MSFLGRLFQGLGGASRPDNRREGRRLPSHGPVTLLWRNALDKARQARADVVEMSPQGLSVRSRRAIPVGREAAVTNGRTVVWGVVRHCSREGRECTLGFEIQRREPLPEALRNAYPHSSLEL